MNLRTRLRVELAAIIAFLGWGALTIQFIVSISNSLDKGRGWAEALFQFFRYFTIQTNIAVALLMTLTAIHTLRGRPLPPARVYVAALVYIVVVFVTYEVLLRREWVPDGLGFFTDMTIHDFVPILSIVFWRGFAPKTGLRWSDPLWMLIYPTLYFAVTLWAGARGEGYPYDFVDVARLGYPTVLEIAILFVAIFYGLAMALTAVGRWRTRSEPAM